MTDSKDLKPEMNDLRRRAEELAQEENLAPEKLSKAEADRLIHGLRVHQIELEMQNEELREAQAKLTEAHNRYADLYDFAPVGYLTLDEWGRITAANLTAASLLKVERSRLLDTYFWIFVVEEERPAFQRLRANLSNLPQRQGEFHLQVDSDEVRPMLLNFSFWQDEHGNRICRLSLTDIAELKQAQAKLRHLTKRLLTTQEEERQRIARDIHDEMGQSLMALKMQLNAAKRGLKRGRESWEEFDQAVAFVDVIADQARKICQSLRPGILGDLGLNGALRQLLGEFRKHHGLEVTEELADMPDLLPPEVQITVYRLVQECLTNATRHGRATRAAVRSYKGDGSLRFICEDNGSGFDLEKVKARDQARQGIGLAAMEERVRLLNGSFTITSAQGQGTHITVSLPLDKPPR
jgi:PAS domain S-box-containing protein